MYIWPIGDQSPTPSGVKQCYLSENEDSVKKCCLLNVENDFPTQCTSYCVRTVNISVVKS